MGSMSHGKTKVKTILQLDFHILFQKQDEQIMTEKFNTEYTVIVNYTGLDLSS